MSAIKAGLKKSLTNLFPRFFTIVQSTRSRALSHRLIKEWGLYDLNRRLIAEVGDRVLSGPFRGMVLSSMARKEHIGPFLLGLYESELNDTWEKIFLRPISQIIDVGAKFGYYAVGLALRFPEIPTIAFDTDPWARRAVREMIAANRIRNLAVHSFCDPRLLADILKDNAFIITDCEGYEDVLFNSLEIPAARTATMIIETHEQDSPGVTARLMDRFRASHEISRIASRSDSLRSDLPIQSLTEDELTRASNEIRSSQEWLFLEPKSPSLRSGN